MKELKWLYEQLPILIDKEIITEEVAQKLQTHYGPVKANSSQNITFIILGILGSVLVGAGIIAVFAYNWDSLGRTARTVVGFLPLLIAQGIYVYTFLKKSDSIAWVESSSAFLMLMVATCIALINQTYHLGFDDLNTFQLTCMVLSIPLMYLMNSSLVTALYLAGITTWAADVHDEPLIYTLLFLAALPHYFINFSLKKTTTRSILLGWAMVVTLGFTTIFLFNGRGMSALIILPLVYLIGKYVYHHPTNPIFRPFQTAAIWCFFWVVYFMGFEFWNNIISIPDNIILQIFWFYIPLAAMLYLIVRRIQEGLYVNYFIVSLPLIVFFIAVADDSSKSLASFLANAYLFLFGLYYLYNGLKSYKIGTLNVGMIFICSVIITRFFDADVSLLFKGIIFILLGIGFLFTNYWMYKQKKHDAIT